MSVPRRARGADRHASRRQCQLSQCLTEGHFDTRAGTAFALMRPTPRTFQRRMLVRAKKGTTPKQAIRYLLSADRQLQKLSLKRMAELKNPKRPAQSIQSTNSAGAKHAPRPRWAMRGPAIVLGVICVVGAAALITAGQPSPGADGAGTEAPRVVEPALASAAAVARVETRKPAASKTQTQTAESARTSGTAQSPIVPNVTVTGCVERDGKTFWLQDTSGPDAPKSRSWKSGFLKKRPSRIELIDATNTLRLSNQVGQRVAATGVLADREMRARSLRSAAGSCN